LLTPWVMLNSFKVIRSKVKVTRTFNADCGNELYLPHLKPYKVQTWYTVGA